MTEANNRTYIMKIASGEMCDHEIMINLDANLIIIGEDNDYRQDISDEGFTAYSIPSHQEPFTFSIISHEGQIAIDLHTKEQSTIIPINLHEVVLRDLFPFCIKQIDTPWENPVVNSDMSGKAIKAENQTRRFKKTPYVKKILIGVSIIALSIISFITIPHYSDDSKDKKVEAIASVINGNHHPVIINEGINNKFLILVENQRDLDWSKQRLLKSKYRNSFTINKIASFEHEVEEKISEVLPELLKLDIKNPCKPVIKISSGKISEKQKIAINNIFFSYLTCYKESQFKVSNINELIKKSELGLTENNVKWHKINEHNKTVFIIKDSLNDKQTASLITFINSFYQQWGERQIKFSFDLENDKLAGKSFITKINGYILLGNNHWLFNSNSR
ncbi:TPA: type III secretion system protein PrgH [Providencia rettgeri]|nr:type III secretion system protein PrgH [Providencia rettgeri]